MILLKPFDGGKKVFFDVGVGEVIHGVDVSGDVNGNFHSTGCDNAAIYRLNDTLVLQINDKRWDFPSIGIRYFHKVKDKTTVFEISEGDVCTKIEYDSWWSAIPGFEPIEPEMDEDEDFYGYLFAVWKDISLQKVLVNRWR
ncbi:hypothetical protein [Vibrio penaeicida]|uniref:hypothetical protein n=1 Tax=Vibrio penaeicida TaxID=104609 RepID=UPI000CE9B994|nr:hypothetical protein [Vibrio penaeicida]